MTREEMLAQAKKGGFVVARFQIKKADADDGEILADNFWVRPEQIISIEPPPETDAERIAELEARIVKLEKLNNARIFANMR